MEHTPKPDHRENPWYLLFWPVFGLRYLLIENFHPAKNYHPVGCFLDDSIPFLEGFVIPYCLWYVCIIGVHLWLFFRNEPAYRKYSGYLILTMGISTAVFLVFPTCQKLRPSEFPRTNRLTEAVSVLYRMDTNTNVCPSEHVIGSAGFFLAVNASAGTTWKRSLMAAVAALLTAAATVFLKQHSLVDVLAAVPVCLLGWITAFQKTAGRPGNISAGSLRGADPGHRSGIFSGCKFEKQKFDGNSQDEMNNYG